MRSNVRPKVASSAEYARLAADCERWGLSQDAGALREKARDMIIQEMKVSAVEAARRARTRFV